MILIICYWEASRLLYKWVSLLLLLELLLLIELVRLVQWLVNILDINSRWYACFASFLSFDSLGLLYLLVMVNYLLLLVVYRGGLVSGQNAWNPQVEVFLDKTHIILAHICISPQQVFHGWHARPFLAELINRLLRCNLTVSHGRHEYVPPNSIFLLNWRWFSRQFCHISNLYA